MNKKFLQLVTGILFCSTTFICVGQDPQFSQFYAAPLYLNPAFTGSALAPRITANYRNQWPSLTANFVTTSVSVDHFFDKKNSGVGLLITDDSQGVGRLKSTDVGLTYSYLLRLDENTNVRLGMQGSYVSRSIDYSNLIFSYDYVANSYVSNSNDPITANGRKPSYLDFSGGALFFNERSWFGVSAHHLNRPDQSFSSTSTIDGKLPIKYSIHGGINFPISTTLVGRTSSGMDKQLVATPAFLFKNQGKFTQLDIGFYLTYSPLTLGLWYRGVPIVKSTVDGINNQDALIALIGYRLDNFSIGYSYDYTISKLGAASGGSHEISISYQFEKWERFKKKTKQLKKEMSCPKF